MLIGWQGGDFEQDIGRSRGGRITKVHALIDAIGRPSAFTLTPGHTDDLDAVAALLGKPAGI